MAAKDPAAVALGRKGGKAKVSKGPTALMTPEQRHEEMRDAEEAQAYAQAMLGATGPVEVRGTEWKWGPGDVPKSSVMSATNALTTSLISAAPDLLEVLVEAEKIIADFDDRDELASEDVGVLKSIRAAIAKATGGTRHA